MKRKRQEEERDVKERMQYTQTDRREREKETKEEERDVKETIQYTQTHTEEKDGKQRAFADSLLRLLGFLQRAEEFIRSLRIVVITLRLLNPVQEKGNFSSLKNPSHLLPLLFFCVLILSALMPVLFCSTLLCTLCFLSVLFLLPSCCSIASLFCSFFICAKVLSSSLKE